MKKLLLVLCLASCSFLRTMEQGKILSPLYKAINDKNAKQLATIIERDKSINLNPPQNDENDPLPPLFLACCHLDLPCVKTLIEHGAQVDLEYYKNNERHTAFSYMMNWPNQKNFALIVRYLLPLVEKKCPATLPIALERAANNGATLDIIQGIHGKKPDITRKALIGAAGICGRDECFEYLLDNASDTARQPISKLLCFVDTERKARHLIERYKADINYQGENGITPLRASIRCGGDYHMQLIEYFCRQGALVEENNKDPILYCALDVLYQYNCIPLLRKYGAAINTVGRKGSVLDVLVREGNDYLSSNSRNTLAQYQMAFNQLEDAGVKMPKSLDNDPFVIAARNSKQQFQTIMGHEEDRDPESLLPITSTPKNTCLFGPIAVYNAYYAGMCFMSLATITTYIISQQYYNQ